MADILGILDCLINQFQTHILQHVEGAEAERNDSGARANRRRKCLVFPMTVHTTRGLRPQTQPALREDQQQVSCKWSTDLEMVGTRRGTAGEAMVGRPLSEDAVGQCLRFSLLSQLIASWSKFHCCAAGAGVLSNWFHLGAGSPIGAMDPGTCPRVTSWAGKPLSSLLSQLNHCLFSPDSSGLN